MNSLDPKITLVVYIGGAIIFLGALLTMFIYNKRMKTKQASLEELGRPPVSTEEGIATATKQGKKF